MTLRAMARCAHCDTHQVLLQTLTEVLPRNSQQRWQCQNRLGDAHSLARARLPRRFHGGVFWSERCFLRAACGHLPCTCTLRSLTGERAPREVFFLQLAVPGRRPGRAPPTGVAIVLPSAPDHASLASAVARGPL